MSDSPNAYAGGDTQDALREFHGMLFSDKHEQFMDFFEKQQIDQAEATPLDASYDNVKLGNTEWDDFNKNRKHPLPTRDACHDFTYFLFQDEGDRTRCAEFIDHVIENFQFHLTTPVAIGSNRIEWEAKVEMLENIRETFLGKKG